MSRWIPFVGARQGTDRRRPPARIAAAAALAAVAGFAALGAQTKVKTLPTLDSSNFFPFEQIDKSNVGQLEMAWFYPYAAPTFSPVFAHDLVYGLGRNASALVALDPATGKEVWVHDGQKFSSWRVRSVTSMFRAAWGIAHRRPWRTSRMRSFRFCSRRSSAVTILPFSVSRTSIAPLSAPRNRLPSHFGNSFPV